jgi:hypothetical protein
MSTNEATLEQVSAAIIDQARSAKSKAKNPPDKFTYAQHQFTVQRRKRGWWISRTWTASAGEKPEWSGPFATIETACLAIARRLAIEIADRHTQSIERHGIEPEDPLYGLKPTTRLDAT